MPILPTRKFIGASAIAAAMLVSTPFAAIAAGGGGGGGGGGAVPSQSAPSYDPAEEYRKGVAALEAEDYKLAIKSFRRAAKGDRRNANAQYLLGVSYMRAGDFKKAAGPLAKAVKLKPDMVAAHRDLAIAYANSGKGDKAQQVLADLNTMKADCAGSCANAAVLDEAVTAASSAINGTAQSSFGPDSARLLQTANGDAAYSRAVELINQGDYTAALASLDNAALAFGPHPDILTYQGFVNRKLGRFSIAEGYYNRALAIAPNHLGAWEYYGELKVERGDMAGAKAHLAKLESLCSFGCYEADELRRWIDTADVASLTVRKDPSA
ncbi:tetratricopeptide repeat protein [Parasphingorhabdus sp. DH2-15]|uniref:tetratricopeptide repeat protein n=1 Tax=Parasphingorhabdus sp. DH2-15 TaxID=3444112 RepID=UPI003F68852F